MFVSEILLEVDNPRYIMKPMYGRVGNFSRRLKGYMIVTKDAQGKTKILDKFTGPNSQAQAQQKVNQLNTADAKYGPGSAKPQTDPDNKPPADDKESPKSNKPTSPKTDTPKKPDGKLKGIGKKALAMILKTLAAPFGGAGAALYSTIANWSQLEPLLDDWFKWYKLNECSIKDKRITRKLSNGSKIVIYSELNLAQSKVNNWLIKALLDLAAEILIGVLFVVTGNWWLRSVLFAAGATIPFKEELIAKFVEDFKASDMADVLSNWIWLELAKNGVLASMSDMCNDMSQAELKGQQNIYRNQLREWVEEWVDQIVKDIPMFKMS
jgi:hypothetical protein